MPGELTTNRCPRCGSQLLQETIDNKTLVWCSLVPHHDSAGCSYGMDSVVTLEEYLSTSRDVLNFVKPEGKYSIDIDNADPPELRYVLEEVINNLLGPEKKAKSREYALAVTKLQEARFWLAEGFYKNTDQSIS